jgi:hypothetical protein
MFNHPASLDLSRASVQIFSVPIILMRALTSILGLVRDITSMRIMTLRMRSHSDGVQAQKECLQVLLLSLQQTKFGREHHLFEGMTHAQFRQAVRIQSSGSIDSFVLSMRRGAKNVLWPGKCDAFLQLPAKESVSMGAVPITTALEDSIRAAWRNSLLFLAARKGDPACLRSPIEWLGGYRETIEIPAKEATARPDIYWEYTTLPACLESIIEGDGRARRTGAGDKYIILVANDPVWIGREGYRVDKARWYVMLQPLFASSVATLDGIRGKKSDIHEIAAGAAGIFAVQDRSVPATGLRLLTAASLFYEFVPLSDYVIHRNKAAGKALGLADAQIGEDYVLLISSPSGLCRFDSGEIVRFLSKKPPRILRMGWIAHHVSLAGESMSERHFDDALAAVCKSHGWKTLHLHVAPLQTTSLTGQTHQRHEWWVELRPGTVKTPTGLTLGGLLDKELCSTLPSYAKRRRDGSLGEPVVRLVMPGVFEAWIRGQGMWDGQSWMPRSLPNRSIADALAASAKFCE